MCQFDNFKLSGYPFVKNEIMGQSHAFIKVKVNKLIYFI